MSTVITSIDRRSPAERAGVEVGEKLLSINAHPIVDVLDYRFYGYDPVSHIQLKTPDGQERSLTLRKAEGQDLGLNFDTYLMDECILSDYLDDEGQKLMFVFDYMTDRAFFLQLKKIITGKSLKDPVCTLSMGKAPDQHIDMKRFEAEIDAKAAKQASIEDFGEDFDEDGYNEDEFDPEGFSDLTFDEH